MNTSICPVNQKYVVIVAGGSGKRVGGEIPKQFHLLAGKPVLMFTIERFYFYDSKINIILALPSCFFTYWEDLCREYKFTIPHTLVEGGSERCYSVKNALKHVPCNSLVAIHDGVRPFVTKQVIENVFKTASLHLTAVPVVSLNDSIRKVEKNTSQFVNRDFFRLVQTPQCFYSELLKEAYNTDSLETFTDDASVVEARTKTNITLVEGNRENIKLTTPIDFLIAEKLLDLFDEKS